MILIQTEMLWVDQWQIAYTGVIIVIVKVNVISITIQVHPWTTNNLWLLSTSWTNTSIITAICFCFHLLHCPSLRHTLFITRTQTFLRFYTRQYLLLLLMLWVVVVVIRLSLAWRRSGWMVMMLIDGVWSVLVFIRLAIKYVINHMFVWIRPTSFLGLYLTIQLIPFILREC